MAIPLLVPIITAAGGAVAGALSRQPEVNRLKQQVGILQDEIIRLNKLIEEQDRQIRSLKMQLTGLKGIQHIQALGRTKGAVMQQYAFKEYVELSCELAKDKSISDQEQRFFNIYENMLNGIEVDLKSKVFLKEYILRAYSYQVEQMITIDPKNIIKRLEETKIA
jgi:hypothetical protein